MNNMTKNTVVINLVGGPCSGKSTTAAGLFALMKLQTIKQVELCTEVIKDYVYSENKEAMNDQVLITAQQNHRLRRLQGKVDFVISDASLLNGVVYNEFYHDSENISTELCQTLYKQYENIVFYLPRKQKYDQYGRTQSEEEAKQIDQIFLDKMDELGVEYVDMRAFSHEEMPKAILSVLSERYIHN